MGAWKTLREISDIIQFIDPYVLLYEDGNIYMEAIFSRDKVVFLNEKGFTTAKIQSLGTRNVSFLKDSIIICLKNKGVSHDTN